MPFGASTIHRILALNLALSCVHGPARADAREVVVVSSALGGVVAVERGDRGAQDKKAKESRAKKIAARKGRTDVDG